MKGRIARGLCALTLALTAFMPSASAQWHVHVLVHEVVDGEDLSSIAMQYVNTNTPLEIYREALVELNYDILREREVKDVVPGDVIHVNYWVDE